MPTIIQVNNKDFKYHELPLVVFLEEPVESVYYVKNPDEAVKRPSPRLFRIEKQKVQFAIHMKVLPVCKRCGKTLAVTKVEPYIHENYRITFQCSDKKCRKHTEIVYLENERSEEFA